MSKVILVNPAWSRLGYSVITPRWLFVIAQATPRDLIGDPILIDEVIEKFDPQRLRSGDILGIGISTGRVIRACVCHHPAPDARAASSISWPNWSSPLLSRWTPSGKRNITTARTSTSGS